MWKVIKCAVQGIGHIDKDIPCQDKVYSLSKNGVTTVALADGAGSAALSHFGAEMITNYICDQFCERFDIIFAEEDGVNVKQTLMNEITGQINILAKTKACKIKDLSSTLLFVSVKENKYILARIGDGIIGYLKNDELKVIPTPKKEGAVNETFFTTSIDALQKMQLIKGNLDIIKGFVLMSDGTETSLYNKKTEKLVEIVKNLMIMCDTHRIDVLENKLTESFESTIKQQTTDDCSIIIIYNADNSKKTWSELSTEELIKLFELEPSEKNYSKNISYYSRILKLLEKKDCTLQVMHSWFHINKKEKKELFNKKLKKLQSLKLIAEIEDGVYKLFII